MSSAGRQPIAWRPPAPSRGRRHGMDLRPQRARMEAERVLRRWEQDRAPPVNGEDPCRSMTLLHRLSADPDARSQYLQSSADLSDYYSQYFADSTTRLRGALLIQEP